MQKTLGLFLFLINIMSISYFYISRSYNGDRRKIALQATHAPSEFLHQGDLGSTLEDKDDPVIFRGDATRQGLYKVSNDRIAPKLAWSSEKINAGIHSASKATPIVDKSGIYVGSDLGYFYRFSFDGEILWSFKTDSFKQGIHGSAALDKDSVYFGNYKGYFYKLNKITGEVRWITLLTEGIGSSPNFWNDEILISAEYSSRRQGLLFSLNRHTGKKIWNSEYFGEQVHSSPSIHRKMSIVGVGDNNGVFHGIDLVSGYTKWNWVGYQPIKSTAVVIDNKFCFTTWEEKLICVNSVTGQTELELKIDSKSQSSPAYDGKRFLFFTTTGGELFKVDVPEKKIEATVHIKKAKSRKNYGMPSPIILQMKTGKYLLVTSCFDSSICFYDSNLVLLHQIDVSGIVTGTFSVFENFLVGLVNNGGVFKIQLF